MDFSQGLLEKLVPKVAAQEADVLVQPTFGTLEVGNVEGASASINLETSSTSVLVGEEFTVDVKIDTKSTRIQSFELIIDFEPSRLTIVDQEDAIPGTQIRFLDSVFEVEEGKNNVSLAEGRITLVASTPSNIAYEIANRTVAQITFQSQSVGSTVIETVDGAGGSKLINSRGTPIYSLADNLVISVTETGDESPPPVINPGDNGGEVEPPVEPLPDTNIEALLPIMPIIVGLFLVALGISLRKSKDKDLHE